MFEKFDRSRYMRNWWKARLCWNCKFLHIGADVDHNHCDCKYGHKHWQEHRVNGHYNHPDNIYYNTDCLEKIGK